ncbi:MAG: hypothetical protein EOO15_10370 [Chitinophagaceae bacterium]|nr:MAG: hypothetical protein EOO15_10370 [Chitinophagaceae bacterium]
MAQWVIILTIMFREYHNEMGLRILFPEKIFEVVKGRIRDHYPVETGGVFIGRVIDGVTLEIEGVLVPDKIVSTRTIFKRASSFLNKCLESLFSEKKGDQIYIGEWHSHPDALPVPSATDKQAMKRISESEGVRISTPVLLIVGFDGSNFLDTFYIYIDNTLVSYGRKN